MSSAPNIPRYHAIPNLLDVSDGNVEARITSASFDPARPEVTFIGIVRADYVIKVKNDDVTISRYDLRIYTNDSNKKLIGRTTNKFLTVAHSFEPMLVANLPKDHFPTLDTVWMTMQVHYIDKQGVEQKLSNNTKFKFVAPAAH